METKQKELIGCGDIKLSQLFRRLDIEQERGMFIAKKIGEEFVLELKKQKEGDVVDLLCRVREISTNATEDMLVCYLVGGIHTHWINRKGQIENVVKNIFGV